MRQFQQQLIGFVSLLVVLGLLLLLFISAVYVAAIVAPLIGLAYAWMRTRVALTLWRSNGRFLLPDNAIRIIGEGPARTLAVSEILSGLGGFFLSLIAPAIVFDVGPGVLASLLLGVALIVSSRAMRRRVAEDSTPPVDILPPE